MFLAEKTVKNYVSNLLAKLGMNHRTQAAVYAARLAERRNPSPAPRPSRAQRHTTVVCVLCQLGGRSYGEGQKH